MRLTLDGAFRMLLPVAILLFTTGISGCRSTTTNANITTVASDKLGAYDAYPNASAEYLLCIQKPVDENSYNRFIVIQKSTARIVLEKTYKPGHVKWITTTALEVYTVPEMIKENEDLSHYKSIIDIALIK